MSSLKKASHHQTFMRGHVLVLSQHFWERNVIFHRDTSQYSLIYTSSSLETPEVEKLQLWTLPAVCSVSLTFPWLPTRQHENRSLTISLRISLIPKSVRRLYHTHNQQPLFLSLMSSSAVNTSTRLWFDFSQLFGIALSLRKELVREVKLSSKIHTSPSSAVAL
jgi:hypothetical protein